MGNTGMKRKAADRIVTVHTKSRVRIHFLRGIKSTIVATLSIGKRKWARFCYNEVIRSGLRPER
jgi:hypothetical protein